MPRALKARRIARLVVTLTLAPLIAPSGALGQNLQCPATAPPGPELANTLFTNLIGTLNYAYANKVGKIDPLAPGDDPPFGTGTQLVDCGSSGLEFCLSKGFTDCDKITAYLNAYDYKGLSQFGLKVQSLSATFLDLKSVALHSSRGPDAGLVTDNVFGPEGAAWNDTTYAVLIPLTGPNYGVTIDLGTTMTICGNGFDCKSGPVMQGDKNEYVLHYSSDGSTWSQYGFFPTVSNDGLQTRGIASISPPADNPSFNARYVRVSAYSGDGNYSISEVRLYDTSSRLVSAGKPAVGPLPAQLTDPSSNVPDNTAWNDKHAVILPDVGSAHAIGIDLGSVKDICGIASGCYSLPVIQADRNVFQLDYSTDGYTWYPYGQFPAVDADGLHTRPINPPPSTPSFSARYVRVWAVSGNGDYSVSKLTLYGPTLGNIPLTTNAVTFGPEPYITNGDPTVPEGGTWNDPRYATVLGLCNAANSICPSPTALTAAITVDMGSAFAINQLSLQADRHSFQVDISSDGSSWTALGTFPQVSGSGILSREMFVPSTTGRYLRVYGVAGDDSNYSVAELEAFTTQANTPCQYAAPNPNAGQNFSCTYQGQFQYQIPAPSATPSPVSYVVDSGDIRIYCSDLFTSDSFVYQSATKGTQCTANLQMDPNYLYPDGFFCAGSCASSSSAAISYAKFQQTAPKFIATEVDCPIPDKMQALAAPLFEGAAAAATQGLWNAILNPNTATPAGVVPWPSSCTGAADAEPPSDIARLKGKATDVGRRGSAATVDMSGQFDAPDAIALDKLILTITGLLDTADTRGELVKDAQGKPLPLLSLQPSRGSKPTRAVYETAAHARPKVRVELAKRSGKQGGVEFSLAVDGASIPEAPTHCGHPGGTVSLLTAFALAGIDTPGVTVSEIASWQCDKGVLSTKARGHGP